MKPKAQKKVELEPMEEEVLYEDEDSITLIEFLKQTPVRPRKRLVKAVAKGGKKVEILVETPEVVQKVVASF